MRSHHILASVIALSLVAGCGGSDPAVATDPVDSGSTDSSKADSAPAADTGSGDDTSVLDSGTAKDTGGGKDTGTIPTDTGSGDGFVPPDTLPDSVTDGAGDAGSSDASDVATDVATDVAADTAPDATALSLDEACTTWSSDVCAKYSTCSDFFVKYIYGDLATCKTRLKLSCVGYLGATGSSYTPGKIITCGKAYSTMTCTDFFSGPTPSECSLAGTIIGGKACGANAQCTSGFCVLDVAATCGTCAPAVSPGGACIKGQCPEDLNCIGATTTTAGLCQKPGKLGDTCSSSVPCSVAFSCFGGKCVTPAAAGTTCDASSTTAADCALLDGLYCDPTAKLCKVFGQAKAGESCGAIPSASYAVCISSGFCKLSGGTTGTCMASAADGATCDTTAGPKCMSPAGCLSSVCKLGDPSSCK